MGPRHSHRVHPRRLIMPIFVTLTGADDRTSPNDLLQLDRGGAPPWFVEIAVLVSLSRQGTPRYPHFSEARRILDTIIDTGMRASTHLCGAVARAAFEGTIMSEIQDLVKATDRIQVNGRPSQLDGILSLARAWPTKTWILQSRHSPFPDRPAENVTWLYDCSGGQGISPTSWPSHPGFEVGYAGGIGPGKIPQVTSPAWIDMESSLRDAEDRFCLATCTAVLKEAWEKYAQSENWR